MTDVFQKTLDRLDTAISELIKIRKAIEAVRNGKSFAEAFKEITLEDDEGN